jgi:hypothetical protein
VADRAEELAAATVAETGIGNVADKTFKNRFASLEVNRTLQGRPGIGPRPPDGRGVTEIASPVGVVLGPRPHDQPGGHPGLQDPDLPQGPQRPDRQPPPGRGPGRGRHR